MDLIDVGAANYVSCNRNRLYSAIEHELHVWKIRKDLSVTKVMRMDLLQQSTCNIM